MSRRRLVVPRQVVEGDRAELVGALHHHLSRVLRTPAGTELELFDGSGRRHLGRVAEVRASATLVTILRSFPPEPEPVPRIVLLYGLSRRPRTELVLQKATELGVAWILPCRCQRSVARPRDPQRKLDRWHEIVSQAARQCGRATLPLLSAPAPLEEALEEARICDRRLVATQGGEPLSRLRDRLAPSDAVTSVALAVGPEGGFTEEELASAATEGFSPLRLGPGILRTETAAIVGVTLVAYLYGRLG